MEFTGYIFWKGGEYSLEDLWRLTHRREAFVYNEALQEWWFFDGVETLVKSQKLPPDVGIGTFYPVNGGYLDGNLELGVNRIIMGAAAEPATLFASRSTSGDKSILNIQADSINIMSILELTDVKDGSSNASTPTFTPTGAANYITIDGGLSIGSAHAMAQGKGNVQISWSGSKGLIKSENDLGGAAGLLLSSNSIQVGLTNAIAAVGGVPVSGIALKVYGTGYFAGTVRGSDPVQDDDFATKGYLTTYLANNKPTLHDVTTAGNVTTNPIQLSHTFAGNTVYTYDSADFQDQFGGAINIFTCNPSTIAPSASPATIGIAGPGASSHMITLNGTVNVTGLLDCLYPVDPENAVNKLYVDDQISALTGVTLNQVLTNNNTTPLSIRLRSGAYDEIEYTPNKITYKDPYGEIMDMLVVNPSFGAPFYTPIGFGLGGPGDNDFAITLNGLVKTIVPIVSPEPVISTHLATKNYVDSALNSRVADLDMGFFSLTFGDTMYAKLSHYTDGQIGYSIQVDGALFLTNKLRIDGNIVSDLKLDKPNATITLNTSTLMTTPAFRITDSDVEVFSVNYVQNGGEVKFLKSSTSGTLQCTLEMNSNGSVTVGGLDTGFGQIKFRDLTQAQYNAIGLGNYDDDTQYTIIG